MWFWVLLSVFLHYQDSLVLMRAGISLSLFLSSDFDYHYQWLCSPSPLSFPNTHQLSLLSTSAQLIILYEQIRVVRKVKTSTISVVITHIYFVSLYLFLNQIQTLIILLSRGIWKMCWYLLAADTRWVIQSGTDGKLILNNDNPGLFHHSWFSFHIDKFTILV